MWILIGYNQIIQVAKKLTRSINKLYDFIQLKTSSLPFNFLSLRITPRKIRLPKHKVAQDHILADKKTQLQPALAGLDARASSFFETQAQTGLDFEKRGR
jgi:phosphoenolpyruvate synthase/pyruvate phosphate dikinase